MTPEQIKDLLKLVKYPGYERDIVSFGLVKEVKIQDSRITVGLRLAGIEEGLAAQITEAVKTTLGTQSGVQGVEVRDVSPPPRSPRGVDPWAGRAPLPSVRHIMAVASGKGGVGKSTLSVNLAYGLLQQGWRVGLLDADIYGPNIPVMLGLEERPRVEDKKIIPLHQWGVKAISVGLLLEPEASLTWRGPMVAKAVHQLLRDVAWGELDCLVVDLPPGTGDAQLTLVQTVPVNGGVIVTTPQLVALADVRRGITMFRSVKAPILGVIENMGHLSCPHCGGEVELFGDGGGRRMAERLDVPFLGSVPFDPELRRASDEGRPLVLTQPGSVTAQTFFDLAGKIKTALEVPQPAPV